MARQSLGIFLTGVALFAVSACSDPQPVSDATEGAEAAPGAEGAEAAGGASASSIPEALRGRWGMNAADCDTSRSDAKGAMEVGADSLKFYESVATLGRINSLSDKGIGAVYDFTGEGQQWQLAVELTVTPDGKTLTRKDSGPDALPDPLTYQRCEA